MMNKLSDHKATTVFSPPANKTRTTIAVLLLIMAACFSVFWQVSDFQLTNLDDHMYVTFNPNIKDGFTSESIFWSFTTVRGGNWHPLTWISFMLDYQLYDLDPGGFHLTNLLLHMMAACLCYLAIRSATGSELGSAAVALLFAIHPMHVESVAWVSERKDVLSGLFWMMTLVAYVAWTKHGGWLRYVVTIMSFLLGLMSKPMLVTLPIILMLLDWWPLARTSVKNGSSRTWRGLVIEKWPLVTLSAAACVVTFLAQGAEGAVKPTDMFPIGQRLANAAFSVFTYLWRVVWPRDMAAYYPHPKDSLHWVAVVGCTLTLILVSYLVWQARRKYPWVLVGWLWYLVTLTPVIGIIQVGKQGMADRYTYIPYVGVFIALMWSIKELLCKWGNRVLRITLMGAVAVWIAWLGCVAHIQTGYWTDSITLFRHTLSVTSRNAIGEYTLGAALDHQGKRDEAMRRYRLALEIDPKYADARHNLAVNLFKMGRSKEAEKHLRLVVKWYPMRSYSRSALGDVLRSQGKYDEAIKEYEKAVKANPNNRAAEEALARLRGEEVR